MKKMMKKLIAMAAALVMIVTLLPAVGVKAESIITNDQATLMIDKHDSQGNSLAGAKFNIYKVAGIDEASSTQLSYTVEEAFKDVINNEQIQNLGSLSTSDLEALAETCAAVEDLPTGIEYTSTKPAHGISILKKDFGLYLVVEESAPTGYAPGAPFFVHVPQTVTTENGSRWEYGVRVTPKNGSTVLDKTLIVNGEETSATNVKNGDTITYKVEGYLPYLTQQELAEDTIEITIKDTLSDGLSFKNAEEVDIHNLQLTIDGKAPVNGVDYNVNVSEDGSTLTITLNNEDFIRNNNGEDVSLTYNAYVKNVSYMTPETNKAEIIFDEKTESESNIPEVYTYAIGILKTASDTGDALQGVEFELYEDEKCEKLVTKGTTGADGTICFDGLAVSKEGKDYWLKETKTVNGYTLLSKPIKITLLPQYEGETPTGILVYKINDGEDQPTTSVNPRLAFTEITNNKGFSLPETGGMGTYLFTIGGIVIMAGAAFALIAMKKRA